MIGFQESLLDFYWLFKAYLLTPIFSSLNIIWRWNILKNETKSKSQVFLWQGTYLSISYILLKVQSTSSQPVQLVFASTCYLLSAAPSFSSSVPPRSFFTLTLTLTDHPEHLCPTSPHAWSDSQITGLHPLSFWFFCQMPMCFSLLIPMALELGHPWDINEPKYLSLLMEFVKSMSYA